jgi:integrase
MRFSEADFEATIWVILADRSKNGKPHVVPLSPYALQMLNEIPRFLDCDYVFTTTHRSPVSDFFRRSYTDCPKVRKPQDDVFMIRTQAAECLENGTRSCRPAADE